MKDDGVPFRDVIHRTSLRYTADLDHIDWVHIVDQSLPSINHYRKTVILHASGQFGINPMILLAKVIHDQKNISFAMLSDQEFRVTVKSFADASITATKTAKSRFMDTE